MATSSVDRNVEKGMPAAVDAERSILGAILLDNTLVFDATRTLRPEHLSLDSHRRLFAAMAVMADANKPIDLITLTELLYQRKELESVGGVAYVSALTDGMPRRPSIEHYIKIVKHKAMLRGIITACNASMAEAFDQGKSAERVLAQLEDQLLALRADDGTELPEIAQQVLEALENWHAERISTRQILGLTTCIPDIDLVTTGIREGEFWIVAAPPARAKTAYALQILRGNCQKGEPGAMFQLEMNRDQVLRRCASAVAKVKAAKTKDMRRPDDVDWAGIQDAMATMAKWPMTIDDGRVANVRQLISKARLYVRRKGARLVIVDHLKALAAKAPGRDDKQKVDYAANALREFAKEENVGVLLLHHINRAGYVDPEERPNMGHLKESGDLEGMAHVILMPWRETIQDAQGRKKFGPMAEIIAAKVRDGGEQQVFPVEFDTATLQYVPRGM